MSLVLPQTEDRAPGRIGIRPDPQVYQRLLRAGGALIENFPLPGGVWVDLEIISFDVSSGGTRFFVSDADGIRETTGPSSRFFRGSVAGDPDSLVSLNLIDGRLAGFVRSGGEEFTFGPRSFSPDRREMFDIEVRDQRTESGPTGACDGDDLSTEDLAAPIRESSSSSAEFSSIDSSTLLIAKVAVEGTVEWVNKHGGVTGAQAYTLNLLAQISATYEAGLNVQLEVPYILMNTSEPDGYSGGSNSTSTVLNEMRTKWNGSASLRSLFRSTVHVFSTYPSGGAGRAYLDVLCNNVPENLNSYDYGVSLLQGDGGSWERRLVAHELGHNFSSRHSHCYAPELDQCYNAENGCYDGTVVQTTGTIMSYCSNKTTIFHQRSIDEMLRPSAEAAFPTCFDVAGMPGALRGQDGSALLIDEASICNPETLQGDDGAGNGAYGYSGTAQAAWMKRFTPSCYPFKLTGVDVMMKNTSIAPGREIRVLIYTDTEGTANPVNATLVHSQNTTVQVVSATQLNRYTLTTPVILSSGDYYLGFYDLTADTATTYIMDYDSSHSGDSWWQANGTNPADFTTFASGSWMIRGQGGGVDGGNLVLSWGPPCNDATVPNQDFAVYQGTIGDWTNLENITCTTARATSWLVEAAPSSTFWLVVPQNSANEGSYGQATWGERPPAALSCKPQAMATCQ